MKISRISLLLYNSLLSLFKIAPFVLKKAHAGHAKVIIRFDDYGVWCNSDWIIIEEEIIRLHEKYGIRISFGVIPDSKYALIAHPYSPSVYPKEYENLDSNPYPLIKGCRRVNVLKDSIKKGISEIALHGYTHPKGYSNTNNTELMGLPYDDQYYKLQQGKKMLEDLFECEVSTFIPPHNTYDKLTLDLLKDLNFKCISAKYITRDAPRCDGLNLKYLWYNYDDVSALKEYIGRNRHFKYEPIIIIMLHHTNFTKEGKIDNDKLIEYEKFLSNLKESNVENFCFSNVPNSEIITFDTAYFLEKDNTFLKIVRKLWPAIAFNYIGYNVNKLNKDE